MYLIVWISEKTYVCGETYMCVRLPFWSKYFKEEAFVIQVSTPYNSDARPNERMQNWVETAWYLYG